MAEIRLLGAVEVWAGETEIDIGAAKPRLVLAALAAEPRKAVPIDVLADRVWGDRLPMRPSGALYQYISTLRRALHPIGVGIVRRNGGYLLDVRDTAVDALRFQRQLSAAKAGEADLGRHVAEGPLAQLTPPTPGVG
jgi:DNA-binding SARP family transcriptional activator